jgi:hypothetical protein
MQERQMDKPDFFIDYHDADVQWARWIAHQLENAQYIVFYRERDIWAGSNNVLSIDDVLQKDVRVILLLSPDYLRKDATHPVLFGGPIWAVKFAKGGLLPIRVRDCLVKGFLSSIKLIDLVGFGEAEARLKLLDSLAKQRKPLTEAPAFPGSPGERKGMEQASRYPGSLPLIWNVPARNRIFTDRDPILTELYEIFKEGQEGRVLTHVIKGLGGIGKTQVAIEYAYRYSHRYDAVVWIDVSNEQTFAEHSALVEKFLALQEQPNTKIADLHNLINPQLAVKQWLQALSGDMRWLLILDNLADFALINDFIPSGGNGHVLITARAQATGIIASAPESLLTLSPEDGALLLLRRTGQFGHRVQLQDIASADLVIAQELSSLMGSLPLALDQAGAYIEDVDLDLPSYLEYYNDSRLRRMLLEKRGEPTMYHPDSVAITWNDAFKRIREFNPVAYSLLLLCSFLHHDAIPERVLSHGASTLSIFQAFAHNPLQRDAAYAELRKYSLLVKESQSKTFSMHRMVQVVLHDSLSADECREWAERAISAVYAGLQADEPNALPFHCGPRYFFHVQSCLLAIKTWGIASDESARLLTLMGTYLHDYVQNAYIGTIAGLDAAVIIDALDDYASVLRAIRCMQEAEQLAIFSDHIREIRTLSANYDVKG